MGNHPSLAFEPPPPIPFHNNPKTQLGLWPRSSSFSGPSLLYFFYMPICIFLYVFGTRKQ